MLFLIAALFAFASHSVEVVHVGSAKVQLVSVGTGRSPSYFHPHESEHSSAVVTRALVHEKGGTLLEIHCEGTRRIAFSLDGKKYDFDPNRMFTDAGLEKTLATHNQEAIEAVKNLRQVILKKLRRSGGPIIAVHNNEGLNINSYQSGGQFAKEASKVALKSADHPHEFFLVLDQQLFNKIADAGFNVVLQTGQPTDDGSLSVYCQKNGLRYINVEAGEGNTSEQAQMLKTLLRLL